MYLKTSDGSHPDNDDGTGDIALSAADKLRNIRQLGAIVIDTDVIAREVVAPGQPALAAIATLFGPGVLRDDGTLNRREVRRLIFEDEPLRDEAAAELDRLATGLEEREGAVRDVVAERLSQNAPPSGDPEHPVGRRQDPHLGLAVGATCDLGGGDFL